ncbi:hypothetical protein E2C01_022421 [Portunus trituberculatus]|uniref:Uncharacterized protein n=1 Tax=Portunus trituberculatus TaxID=210409 RepID=A0A5B7E705_PORTR|nr:hypothetical protein [Portunus trituberculatus]
MEGSRGTGLQGIADAAEHTLPGRVQDTARQHTGHQRQCSTSERCCLSTTGGTQARNTLKEPARSSKEGRNSQVRDRTDRHDPQASITRTAGDSSDRKDKLCVKVEVVVALPSTPVCHSTAGAILCLLSVMVCHLPLSTQTFPSSVPGVCLPTLHDLWRVRALRYIEQGIMKCDYSENDVAIHSEASCVVCHE